MNTTSTTVPDVLDAAADYIEQHGWTQGMTYDHQTGQVCALGAIEAVNADWPLHKNAMDVLDEAVGGFTQVWNDDNDRTQDEVVAKLREVAAAQRGDAA